jgi:hypothetical protein
MSYQERRAIVSLLSTLLVAGLFVGYALPHYPAGNAYSPAVFHYWGTVVVLFIPISIAANIAFSIIFTIIYTMATREKSSSISDERDQVIDLRATQITVYVFAAGFFLAMGSLVIDQPPNVMFIVLMISGYVAGIVGNFSQLYLYRRGS